MASRILLLNHCVPAIANFRRTEFPENLDQKLKNTTKFVFWRHKKTTDCAYDHIVLKGDNMRAAWSDAAVYDYQTDMGTDNIFYDL